MGAPVSDPDVPAAKSLYLAGPMRGYDLFNFPAFEDAERRLSRYFEVFSPPRHDLDSGFDPSLSLEAQAFDLAAAMEWDLHAIRLADIVVLLPGWEKSSGVYLEMHYARFCGRTIYTYKAIGDGELYELHQLGDRHDQPVRRREPLRNAIGGNAGKALERQLQARCASSTPRAARRGRSRNGST